MNEVFLAVAEYGFKRGVQPIKDKLWHVSLDEHWEFVVNGFKEEKKVMMKGSQCEHTVPPFAVYVEFNGWPAGIFDAYDGQFVAGELANQTEFCEVLKRHGNPS